jgi:hypothetical protein
MIFFIVGLQFKNPVIIAGKDVSMAIAVSLSISNTIIQIIGNDQEQDSMGFAMWLGWIGSYALGIGTNTVGLVSILGIENVYIEWTIALGLGTVIEVMPERLLVEFLKGFVGVANNFGRLNRQQSQQNSKNEPKYHNPSENERRRLQEEFENETRGIQERRKGNPSQVTFGEFHHKSKEKKPYFTFRR